MFKKFVIVTIISLYLLIAIGGLVRASGSGMGCPDWPKCFGLWVPPTDISQLPSNFRELYSTRYHNVTEFNVVKTWTEYINRLIGVLIGFFVFVTAILSLSFYKKDKLVTISAVASFLLVAFQGWLGAQVVFFNLRPFIVTLHMLLAIVIVLLLLLSYFRVIRSEKRITQLSVTESQVKFVFVLVFLSTVQIILGTQVRQKVDLISKFQSSTFKMEELGILFYVHRSFSAVLLLLLATWIMKNKESIFGDSILKRFTLILLSSLGIVIFAGIILNYFDFPLWAQPIHLTFGCVFIGMLILIGLYLSNMVKPTHNE